MNTYVKYIILLFLLTFLSNGFAQKTDNFVQYTVADGLPSNNVYQALQDKKGYMWFATEGGVAKFDGREFKNFTVKDGLPTNDIYQMVEDEVGRIWLHGNSNIAFYIENEKVIAYKPKYDFTAPDFVKLSSINFSFTDGVILQYSSCRILIDKDLNETLLCNRAYTDEYSEFLVELDKEHAYYGHFIYSNQQILIVDNTILLYNMDDNKIDTINTRKPLVSKSNISDHDLFLHNEFLFHRSLDEKDLYVIDSDSLKVIDVINLDSLLGAKPSHVRFEWLDRNLQIQTNLGVIILNYKGDTGDYNIEHFSTKEISNPKYVNRVMDDRNSNLWICTRNEGVKMVSSFNFIRKKLKHYYGRDLSSLMLQENNLFVGTKDGKIYITGSDNFSVDLSSNESDNSISQMTFDTSKNRLYFIKDGMGLCFVDSDIKNVTMLFGEGDSRLYNCVFEQDYSYLYKGVQRVFTINKTRNPYSYYIDEDRLVYLSSNLVINYEIDQCKIDTILYQAATKFEKKDSTYYLMFNDYISICDSNFVEFKKVVFANSVVDVKPYNNGLLVLLNNADLIYLIRDIQVKLGYIDHLRPSNCRKLLVEEETIWISTTSGVYTYSIDDINLNLERYEIIEGINDFILKEDSLYVATDYGLAKSALVNGDNIILDCPIYLEVTDLLNNELFINNGNLGYNQNNLKFHFDVLDYASLGDYEIDIKLISNDTVLIKTNENSITLPNLASGAYLLEYYVVDTYGRISEVRDIDFVISKPWWARTSTIIGYAVLGLLMSIMFYWLTMKRLKRKEALRIDTAKKMAELRLTALQSQMNPHFIFNSLNSIQYLIQIKDAENADKYLSKFSELLRSFLENSREKFVAVNKELTLLHNYCKLELLRFENKISLDYRIELTETEQRKYLIPTSILQPIVENAVVHGLFHKKGMGLLSILVRIVGNQLEVKVKDNGIGRKKSKELNEKRNKGHQSLGGQMILEKLEVLEKIDSYQVSIQYSDLFNKAKESIGTEVLIRMPLKESKTIELMNIKLPHN